MKENIQPAEGIYCQNRTVFSYNAVVNWAATPTMWHFGMNRLGRDCVETPNAVLSVALQSDQQSLWSDYGYT